MRRLPFNPADLEWAAGLRAAICVLIPLLILLRIDRLDLTLYASFAAFTSLYGRSEVYRSRAISVATAAAMMFVSILAGAGIQALGSPTWLVVTGFLVVTWLGSGISRAMELVPRGAIFVVFAYLGSLIHPLPEDGLASVLIIAASTCALSFVVALAGAPVRAVPARNRHLPALARMPARRASAAWDSEANWLVLATLFAAGTAWAIVALTGAAGHQYWAIVTVVAILSGPNALQSYTRAGHRVVGTLAGIGVSAALFGSNPSPLHVIIVVTLCQFVTEATVGVHYGFALGFITPIALGAANITGAQEWSALFTDRARETMIGGAVCLALIAVVRAWMQRSQAKQNGS